MILSKELGLARSIARMADIQNENAYTYYTIVVEEFGPSSPEAARAWCAWSETLSRAARAHDRCLALALEMRNDEDR